MRRYDELPDAVLRLDPATVVVEPDAFALLLATRRATAYDAPHPAAN